MSSKLFAIIFAPCAHYLPSKVDARAQYVAKYGHISIYVSEPYILTLNWSLALTLTLTLRGGVVFKLGDYAEQKNESIDH